MDISITVDDIVPLLKRQIAVPPNKENLLAGPPHRAENKFPAASVAVDQRTAAAGGRVENSSP
jgi:hypothetical protein